MRPKCSKVTLTRSNSSPRYPTDMTSTGIALQQRKDIQVPQSLPKWSHCGSSSTSVRNTLMKVDRSPWNSKSSCLSPLMCQTRVRDSSAWTIVSTSGMLTSMTTSSNWKSTRRSLSFLPVTSTLHHTQSIYTTLKERRKFQDILPKRDSHSRNCLLVASQTRSDIYTLKRCNTLSGR